VALEIPLQQPDTEDPEDLWQGARFFPKAMGDVLKLRRKSQQLHSPDATVEASSEITAIPTSPRQSSAATSLIRDGYLGKLRRRKGSHLSRNGASAPKSSVDPSAKPPQLAGPDPVVEIVPSSPPKNVWNITETITDENIVRVVGELLTTSKALLLQENQISGIGAHRLSELLLCRNPRPKIETLNLSMNQGLFSEIAPESQKTEKLSPYPGAIGIGGFLKETTSLEILSLRGCVIPLISLNFIVNGLRGNESLEFLDLSETNLDDEAALPLCRALEEHPKLCVLLLGENKFSDESAGCWIELVRKNQKIVLIDLAGNALSAEVMDQIASQCETNSRVVPYSTGNI